MSSLEADLHAQLRALEEQGLARALCEPAGIDFSSNDYLGFARHPALAEGVRRRLEAEGVVGAPASRLLTGHTRRHRELEERLAELKGTERALLFPSGYQANLALLTTLLGREDRALSDAQNHASLIDGLRLSGCAKLIIPHLDLTALERALAAPWPAGRTFVVTESLFSMDGDSAALDQIAGLAERHGASLLVDDAHATGLYGEARGSGLLEVFGIERRVAAVVSTFGKALGVSGAFVAGPAVVIETLVQRARPFIFTTALPPLLLYAIEAALDLLAAEPERRRRVHALAERLRARLRAAGLDCLASAGPIVPVILGENRRALAVAEELQRRGFDVRAVRPPTVAPGSARLRLSIHADHTPEQIDELARAIVECAVTRREETVCL